MERRVDRRVAGWGELGDGGVEVSARPGLGEGTGARLQTLLVSAPFSVVQQEDLWSTGSQQYNM